MPGPISGSGPKVSMDQGDNDEAQKASSVESVRYMSQVSEDEGYHSNSEVQKINDRTVQANPCERRKKALENFQTVFRDVCMKTKAACNELRIRPQSMPRWYQEHVYGDARYPVAFVRGLEHLAPDKADELKAKVRLYLAEIEAILPLDEGFEDDSALEKVPSWELIRLIEARITYHVLLGDVEAAQQLASAAESHYKSKDEFIYALQDALFDITRNLHLPVGPKSE